MKNGGESEKSGIMCLGGVVSGGVMVARKFAFSSYGVLVSVSKSFTVPASCILTPIPLRPKVVRQSCTAIF